MDSTKFERLVEDSEFSTFLLATPALDKFVMVSEVPTGEYAAELTERGFAFIGVVGVTNGWPRTVLAVPLEPRAIQDISRAYLRYVAEHFPPKADRGADWLTELWSLEDPRS